MKKIVFILLLTVAAFPQKKQWVKVADSLNFPEGPAWNGEVLLVSSCYGGFITTIKGNDVFKFIDSTQQPFRLKQTNGLTFGKDGNLYACDYGIGAILRISPAGKTEIIAPGYNGKKFNRPNDLAFHKNGLLYFTDPKSYNKEILDGAVYSLNTVTGEVKQVFYGLGFPNGIAFSKTCNELYVCESAKNRILKFKVDKDGSLKDSTVFIELPGGDPDGIGFDKNENLYVAHFGSGKIYVISPKGKIINTIDAPGKKPSNVEFAGKSLKTLYITEDETNSVYKMELKTGGRPLFNSPVLNKK